MAALFVATSALAEPADWRESGQTALHLLDYVGVAKRANALIALFDDWLPLGPSKMPAM
mgnify:CR=1 FL=1